VFDLSYLVAIFTLSTAMALALPRISAGERPAAARMALAFALLGTGDLGHVGLRVLATLEPSRFAGSVGWGGLPTAVTVTLFYLLMLDAWRVHFDRPVTLGEWALVGVAVLRLLLLIPPANHWGDAVPPFGWSLLRNVPLVVLGLAVTALYLRDGRRPGQRPIFTIGLLMAVSYACYGPVILLVQRYPMVGLLMIPKTVAYLAMGVVAWFGFFRQPRFSAPATGLS
jgi:hypothetical protein